MWSATSKDGLFTIQHDKLMATLVLGLPCWQHYATRLCMSLCSRRMTHLSGTLPMHQSGLSHGGLHIKCSRRPGANGSLALARTRHTGKSMRGGQVYLSIPGSIYSLLPPTSTLCQLVFISRPIIHTPWEPSQRSRKVVFHRNFISLRQSSTWPAAAH